MVYMDTEAASIFLLDAANEQLTCLACAGPVSIEGLSIAKTQGIVGRALADRSVQMVRDVSADGDFSSAVDDRTGFCTRSILCAPLMVKGRLLGALEVINKCKGDGLFDLADKQFLQVLAGMVSLAVHNAQMTEALVEQERMRRELDLAREIQRTLLPAQPEAAFPVHGINLSALAVFAGAVGVGLGLGLQTIAANFISGLQILAERPIKIGDRITVDGMTGQVQEIRVRATTVVTEAVVARSSLRRAIKSYRVER